VENGGEKRQSNQKRKEELSRFLESACPMCGFHIGQRGNGLGWGGGGEVLVGLFGVFFVRFGGLGCFRGGGGF